MPGNTFISPKKPKATGMSTMIQSGLLNRCYYLEFRDSAKASTKFGCIFLKRNSSTRNRNFLKETNKEQGTTKLRIDGKSFSFL